MTNLEGLKREVQGPRALVSKARRHYIPSGEALARKAWDRISGGRQWSAEEVMERFDDYLCTLMDTEYQIYLEHEERCINEGVFEIALDPQSRKMFPNVHRLITQALATIHDVHPNDRTKLSLLTQNLRPFYKFMEQSFAQGRKSRAGGSAQVHLKRLLEIVGYAGEFETQCVLNGTVDFLFPSFEAWERDRRRCVIVSVKRSLRERYKQAFEELGITRGMTIYLFITETLQEAKNDLTASKILRLNEQNIYLVVRDEIKRTYFPDANNVIAFTTFIQKELPARRAQWQA